MKKENLGEIKKPESKDLFKEAQKSLEERPYQGVTQEHLWKKSIDIGKMLEVVYRQNEVLMEILKKIDNKVPDNRGMGGGQRTTFED